MRELAVAAALALAVVPAVPAYADPAPAAGVRLHRDVHAVPLDHGHFVQVVCNATADPGAAYQVAVATTVGCSIDGVVRTRGMPGPEAVTTITAASFQPLTFCIWGEAAFVDPVNGRVTTVERVPECETLIF